MHGRGPTTTASSPSSSPHLQPRPRPSAAPRAKFAWGAAGQQSVDALKAAPTSAPVLRACVTRRGRLGRACSPTLAVSAILGRPGDAGASESFRPVAFESCNLTPPERSRPPCLLVLLAVVHVLKALRPHRGLIMTSENIRRVGSTCWPNSSTAPCTSRAEPHRPGRLPHREALPRRPRPGAAHGPRRAGFGA